MRGQVGSGGRAGRALVVVTLLLAMLPAAVAQGQVPTAERLSGADRFATAAAVSAATFDPGVEIAYVATGGAFPDALAGGPLAGTRGAPILLTGRDALPEATVNELQRLAPAAITVLGGAAAVSDAVLVALDDLTPGPVGRLAGASRFATAAAISEAGFEPGVATAYVATGENFPDALAGGAAGAATGGPVLLTGQAALPEETRAELSRLAPASIAVLGGAVAVSDAVLAELDGLTAGQVRRLAGADRFATAAAVAADTFPERAPAVFLATGGAFPDALAGAPAAGQAGGPLLLVNAECAPPVVVTAVERLDPARLVVLGGPVAVSDAAAALQPCGGEPPPPGTDPPPEPPPPGSDGPPPPTFTVDTSLEPDVEGLAPLDDGEPRPVARLVDELGSEVDFVQDELLVATDDPAQLDAVRQRWSGTVLDTVELPGDAPDVHLLRVDASAADVGALGADSQEIDPLSRGAHRASSQAGLELIAAGASEAADGLAVGLNALIQPQAYVDRTLTEGATGNVPGLGSSSNPYTWTYMTSGSPQDMGVGEAWRMLALGGRMTNKVRIAVIDGGFAASDPDYPPGAVGSGQRNQASCGGSPCPFHGTGSAQTVAAVPDNSSGTAGSAGPVVGQLDLLDSDLGLFSVIGGVLVASGLDARVITMSFGLKFPAVVSWANFPLEVATAAVAGQGRLLFAAAGNDDQDVDAEDCFIACWEETNHSPCENDGVICVGGLAPDSRNRDPGSNFGHESCESEDCSVKLFGPWTVFIGSNPDNMGSRARVSSGTSVATPFVAGVAALVWSANPGLSAGDVRAIMFDTANPSDHPQVPRVVNAREAVRRAIGNVPPAVRITGPPDGTSVPYGISTPVSAEGDDYEDGVPCCLVRFTTDGAGDQGFASNNVFGLIPGGPGPRRVTPTATDSAGAVGPPGPAITINATNTPPQVDIAAQPSGPIYQGLRYPYRGTIVDQNEGEDITCDALEWVVRPENAGVPQRGCRPRIAIQVPGSHGVNLGGTDEQGATASDVVLVDVLAIPPNSAPIVSILNPQNGDRIPSGTTIQLEGEAGSDEGADAVISYRWTQTDESGVKELGSTPTLSWTSSCPIGGAERTLTLTATDDDGSLSASVKVECTRGPN